MNLYTILEVAEDATLAEIKKSYRALAQKHHPDKGGDEERFKEINRAYSILSDEEKRAYYDRHGDVNESTQRQLDDVLASMIEEALEREVADISKHVLKEIEAGTQELNRKERKLDKREERIKKAVKRVKCKRGSDPITDRINAKLASLQSERVRIKQTREALEYVKGRITGDFDFEIIEEEKWTHPFSGGGFVHDDLVREMMRGATRGATDERDL